MKIEKLISQYTIYRKSLGEKFEVDARCLKAFCKAIGPSKNIQSVPENMINNFLYGDSKIVTSWWFRKHSALLRFYQYALTHHYVDAIPLPCVLPKRPQPFIPYIYSREELKLLFDTALIYQKIKSHTSPFMVRVVLVLTYALGLRLHETLSIALNDIDMDNLVITIQQSKFYKSRLVPFNQKIKEIIEEYLRWRIKQKQSQSSGAPLFMGKNNHSFNIGTMRGIFIRIRKKAGIKRNDNAKYRPRIHDLRHSFAIHRLTSWYQENKNVQQLLPILSVYLGHGNLSHTAVYLTMTDELLQEAGMRFEKYATGEQQ